MRRIVSVIPLILAIALIQPVAASGAIKAGSPCPKLNATKIESGMKYSCIKSGSKTVWSKGIAIAKPIDYSSCLELGTITVNYLKQETYSNVAANFGQNKVYGAQLVQKTTPRTFGFDDLSFTNGSPCKVSVRVSGDLTCYAPSSSNSSQANSISINVSPSGAFEVSANSKITVNAKSLFGYTSRSCELTPFHKFGGRSAAAYGLKFLNFGSDISELILEVTGADPEAQLAAQAQASSAAKQDTSIGSLKCNPQVSCPLGSLGPGGGIVFYDAGKQMPWGRYIEVAPADWNRTPDDPLTTWCGQYINVSPTFESQLADTVLQNSMGPEIGKGKPNSAFMVANCITQASVEGAAVLTAKYSGGGKTDWFLPSKDELNELCKFAQGQASVSASTPCGASGKLRPGLKLKTNAFYWSSTEIVSQAIPNPGVTWDARTRFLYVNGRSTQVLSSGRQSQSNYEYAAYYRPVRYFN